MVFTEAGSSIRQAAATHSVEPLQIAKCGLRVESGIFTRISAEAARNRGLLFASLGKNMQAKNGEAAAEDAKKLAGLFKEVEAFWAKSNTADAIAFAQAAQKASSEAAASAKANNFEQASAAVGGIGKNCKGCHDAHKPKK